MTILCVLGQRAHRGADLRLADRLRGDLHRVPEARDAAEHRDRRHRRRGAAGAGLGRGHRHAGELDWPHALLLVLIIFVWTPPHFWALAIFRREDYAQRDDPDAAGDPRRRVHALADPVLHGAAGGGDVLPCITGMSGLFYLGGALVLGAVFL